MTLFDPTIEQGYLIFLIIGIVITISIIWYIVTPKKPSTDSKDYSGYT